MDKFIWRLEDSLRVNADRLGKALSKTHPHLYRTAQGLIEAILVENKVRFIDSARKLGPLLIDHLDIQVMRGGKIVGDLPQERSLNALLGSERFLRWFKPVDLVTFFPVYLPDFSVAPPGYYDGGPGHRILYLGPEVQIAHSMEAWNRFLPVMDCDSEASRTNILGAALTVLTRHHFPGHKPLILVTANQSHAGKGTVIEAIRGRVPKANILYQASDWPMQSELHKQLNANSDIGFIDLDNVRKDSSGVGGNFIRSGFFESLVTSPDVKLNSPTGGTPINRRNDLVLGINTNEGTASPDLLNRGIWIHLAPEGDIHERHKLCPIGNPKTDYLPQHQQQMEAELHGLIARWKAAGCPRADVYHPMSDWVKTIGGILQFAGYKGFMANFGQAAQLIDPQRRAVAILGAAKPGVPMRAAEWAQLAVDQVLAKTLFSPADRDTPAGRERGIGVIFKRYLFVSLEAETATHRLRLKLVKVNKRWERGLNPYVKYKFEMVKELALVEQLVNLTSSSPPKEVTANAQPYTPLTPLTHGGDEWETPKWVFDEWSAREGPFDLDPAATPANAKCPKYFTKKEHGLKRKWKGKVWLNPPYSEIDLWLQKARASAEQGALVVCLVPVWTDRPWWHEHVEGKAEVHFLTGRVKFVGAKGTAPFASAVIIYRP